MNVSLMLDVIPLTSLIPCGALKAIEITSPFTPTTTPSPNVSCSTLSPLFQDDPSI